jgi:HPt (histidine-containing phosphotransfer) domain-containing protein
MKTSLNEQKNSIETRLLELIDLAGPNFAHELIDLFFKAARKDLELMKKAVRDSSAIAFSAAAHSLKSSGLNLGAANLGQACRNAEAFRTFTTVTQANELLKKVEIELAVVESILIDYIKESHTSAS